MEQGQERGGSRIKDYGAALAKCEREGACRSCGASIEKRSINPVHTIGADKQDKPWQENSPTYWVNPASVLPMCAVCEKAYLEGFINILLKMSVDEQLNAVEAAGGILPAVDKIAVTKKRPGPGRPRKGTS